jgi:hypothetical protein
MKISEIAGVCHEANRAICKFFGDDSQVPWDEASGWQVESACHGVAALMTHPDLTPAQQHELWMQHKLDNGWCHGFVKDEEKKTHPCLVPYEQLPEHQRLKDHVFQAIVRAFLHKGEPA